MTELDYLKCKLEDKEKAFDELHKQHIILLKQQGELERKNEQYHVAQVQLVDSAIKIFDENVRLKEQIRIICNYIQTRYNECQTPKLKEFVNPAFLVEEGSGYKGALYDLKKGLMKRGVWEITINEHEYTKINTDGWNK